MVSIGDIGKSLVDSAGDIVGAGIGAFGGWMANQANMEISQKQMDFQKHMYKNRYRYQMEDMRKAGLNPMLGYQQGPPGAPGGAGIPAKNIAEGAVSTAMDVRRTRAVVKQAEEQLKNTAADTAMKRAQSHLYDNQSLTEFFKGSQSATEATTARHIERIRKAEANRMEKVGDSVLGRQLDTAGKLFEGIKSKLSGLPERQRELRRRVLREIEENKTRTVR